MKIKIEDYPTFNKEWDKDKTKDKTKKILKKIGELQNKMYAQNKFSLLIVLQGTDASGKDGVTKGLVKYCNPLGVKIHSFRKPTEDEYAHDFLWRVHNATPRKGEMKIFIRSHYEDILVPSVEKYIPEDVIERRYKVINDFEKLLENNGTIILKFFMNVSMEAQKERLMERIELKEKHWKHKDGDWDTREKWDKYKEVYEKILNNCNIIPWHLVPSDKNWQKTYAVAEAVLKALEDLDLKWPELVTEKFKPKAKEK
ncbi:MAG: polyphosphate kinase 2 family protein [Bacteroidales bacterium]|jgi:PPK2 family polyphosphate:nucleotide phosphotransferase|nr:polyphosphate kinase 2 family protein [Bacteroidales bacterium]